MKEENRSTNKPDETKKNDTESPKEQRIKQEEKQPTEDSYNKKANTNNNINNKTSEDTVINKTLSLSKLKDVVGKDVTWVAIASIGGAVIVIWNIIKYIFMIVSSYILHFITNVPVYLLMMRKNVAFTDVYLFYLTLIILFTLSLPLKFANKKVNQLLTHISFIITLSLISCAIIVLFNKPLYYKFHQIFNIIISYLIPIFIPFYTRFIRFWDIVINKKLYNILIKKKKRNKLKNVQYIFTSYDYSLIPPFFYKLVSITTLLIIIAFLISYPTSALIDQDSRYIVADLGERFIVQDAVYDQDEQLLTIDNTCYNIIDNCDESIETILLDKFIVAKNK